MNWGTLLVFMLEQALLHARAWLRPTIRCQRSFIHRCALRKPMQALHRRQMVVDEITCHCDILARIMQEYSGKLWRTRPRVRAHTQRMEHSPIRRVRARRERNPEGGIGGGLSGEAAVVEGATLGQE